MNTFYSFLQNSEPAHGQHSAGAFLTGFTNYSGQAPQLNSNRANIYVGWMDYDNAINVAAAAHGYAENKPYYFAMTHAHGEQTAGFLSKIKWPFSGDPAADWVEQKRIHCMVILNHLHPEAVPEACDALLKIKNYYDELAVSSPMAQLPTNTSRHAEGRVRTEDEYLSIE